MTRYWKKMSKVERALFILNLKFTNSHMSIGEYNDRLLAICVWAKRRIFKKMGVM